MGQLGLGPGEVAEIGRRYQARPREAYRVPVTWAGPLSGKGQAVELPGRASVSGYTRLGPVMLPEWFASAWDR
jgi:hypothetical protein